MGSGFGCSSSRIPTPSGMVSIRRRVGVRGGRYGGTASGASGTFCSCGAPGCPKRTSQLETAYPSLSEVSGRQTTDKGQRTRQPAPGHGTPPEPPRSACLRAVGAGQYSLRNSQRSNFLQARSRLCPNTHRTIPSRLRIHVMSRSYWVVQRRIPRGRLNEVAAGKGGSFAVGTLRYRPHR
ncbi:hypothetical protein VTK73DRAFT_1804 [Phialemonium thermophilum]|uniref:Uncharacterized protein n=1 Tax=Phialemonium thermophilum TaxID=223376 RepID=A0ABR3VT00_9PEZI